MRSEVADPLHRADQAGVHENIVQPLLAVHVGFDWCWEFFMVGIN